jgi:hypothetical protein
MPLIVLTEGGHCDGPRRDGAAALVCTSRVLSPQQMTQLLPWHELDRQVSAEKERRLQEAQEELADWVQDQQHELAVALGQQLAHGRASLAALEVSSRMRLRAQAMTLAEEMATQASLALNELVKDDPELITRFYRIALGRVVDQLDRLGRISIHVAPDQLPHLEAALGALPESFQLAVEVHEAPDLEPQLCIVRTEDQLFEVELQGWMDGVERHLQSLAADVVETEQGLVPDESSTADVQDEDWAPDPELDDWAIQPADGEFAAVDDADLTEPAPRSVGRRGVRA